MSELRELTRELVSIPSHEDEQEAGSFLEAWLCEQTGARVERDDHGNVFAYHGPPESTPELALVGHHDVVPPDETQLENGAYVIEEREGRLYGRGAADMKGAVAAMLLAFRETPREGLAVVSFVGEELGGEGARAAIDDGFAPEYAVVGEGSTGYSAPGVTDVAVAHKGRRASTLSVSGAAAHASEPEAGENAVYRATEAVEAVRDLPAPETTVLGHELAGTVVVTEIEGGSAWNVVPEACTVTVDERTVPDERAPLGDVESDHVDRTIVQDLPPMACRDEAFAETVLEAAGATQSADPRQVVKPHATDAGWLSGAGTSCVICGPAELGEAHTATESVSVEVLERCERIYRECARRLLSA